MTSFPVWQHCRKEVQSAVKSIWSSKIHLKTWLKSKDDKFGNPVGTQAAFLKYRHTVSVQQTGLKQQHCLERSDYTQHRTERNKRSIADVFAVLSQCVCVCQCDFSVHCCLFFIASQNICEVTFTFLKLFVQIYISVLQYMCTFITMYSTIMIHSLNFYINICRA